ncbi:MAG: AraC family transcriptional regulator [Eubacteriales bacterium]|nr:AraC family transcriptional regulator [Eubacteriales bacterium]
MIDSAGIRMAQGAAIACERIEGVNDNMSQSHYHDYYELYYLEGGERFHVIQDELHHVEAGQYVIFAPFVMHYSYGAKDVPFKRIVLYFKPDQILYPSLLAELKESSGVYKADKKESFYIHQYLCSLLAEENSGSPYLIEGGSDSRKNYMQSMLNVLMLTTTRKESLPSQAAKLSVVSGVINYIHQNYDTNITLESLSKMFFTSQYHLCREFKRFTNRTLVEYINVTRIMNAQRKIMETKKSFTEISQESGFSSLTHFNRVFKSIVGTTPSEYRKNYPKEAIEKLHETQP